MKQIYMHISICSENPSLYNYTLVDVIFVKGIHNVSKVLWFKMDSRFLKSYVLNLSIKSIKFNVFLCPLAPSGTIAITELTDMVSNTEA